MRKYLNNFMHKIIKIQEIKMVPNYYITNNIFKYYF